MTACLLIEMGTVVAAAFIFLHFCPIMNHEYHQTYAMFACSALQFLASKYRHCWFLYSQSGKRLFNTSTHDQHWESNPRPFKILSPKPYHAPTVQYDTVLHISNFIWCRLMPPGWFSLSNQCLFLFFSHGSHNSCCCIRGNVWRSTMDAATWPQLHVMGVCYERYMNLY